MKNKSKYEYVKTPDGKRKRWIPEKCERCKQKVSYYVHSMYVVHEEDGTECGPWHIRCYIKAGLEQKGIFNYTEKQLAKHWKDIRECNCEYKDL